MATRRQRQIIETPTEARQAEPGPSILALLLASTGLAVLILGVLWFVFFRTWGGDIPASFAQTVNFPTIIFLPIWFGVFPETGIAQDSPTACAAALRTRGSAIGKVFGVKNIMSSYLCDENIAWGATTGRIPCW
jgi:hypothetical protein